MNIKFLEVLKQNPEDLGKKNSNEKLTAQNKKLLYNVSGSDSI